MRLGHVAGAVIWTVAAAAPALGQQITRDIWVEDLNGRLTLGSRQIERTTSPTSDVKETEIAIFRPGINQPLEQTERITERERQVAPGVVCRETTLFRRDVNGRFQRTETRIEEVRTSVSDDADVDRRCGRDRR
jgi:hypothetical protein